jgi:hypothetical protein
MHNDYGLSSFSTYIDHHGIDALKLQIKFCKTVKKNTEIIIYDNAGCIISTTPQNK